jgi:predicted exporter
MRGVALLLVLWAVALLAILLGGLLAVALVLLAALRSARRALVPLVPIVLATIPAVTPKPPVAFSVAFRFA